MTVILCLGCATSRQLKSGDLLFVGLPVDYASSDKEMSGAIAEATGEENAVNYIHVAIVEVDEQGKLWIVDATTNRGVDRHPMDTTLSDFRLKDGSYPVIDLYRLRNSHKAAQFAQQARQFCGQPYDLYFLPDNGAMYCSELVYESYVTKRGRHLFMTVPMNFKSADGTYPIYWINLFERIGQPIPQGVPGTNPNDMAKARNLKKIRNSKLLPQ
ncbi:MAG: hypothetical protein K6A41_00695 [Bacteroidales bacterium]|nr:hypothetical protein [Bacteroidales bacterium]